MQMYTPGKLIWQWNITIFNGRYIFEWLFFHCHVSFRGVNVRMRLWFKMIDYPGKKNKHDQILVSLAP